MYFTFQFKCSLSKYNNACHLIFTDILNKYILYKFLVELEHNILESTIKTLQQINELGFRKKYIFNLNFNSHELILCSSSITTVVSFKTLCFQRNQMIIYNVAVSFKTKETNFIIELLKQLSYGSDKIVLPRVIFK